MRHYSQDPIPDWQHEDALFRRLRRAGIPKDPEIFYGAVEARGRWWEYAASGYAVLARAVSKPDRNYRPKDAPTAGGAYSTVKFLLQSVPRAVGMVEAEDVERMARHAPKKGLVGVPPCMRFQDERKKARYVDPRLVEIVARSVDGEAATYLWANDDTVTATHGLAMRTAEQAAFCTGQTIGSDTARCTKSGLVLPSLLIAFPKL
jgi:hypothetical protein